jgi:hypothetical protein
MSDDPRAKSEPAVEHRPTCKDCGAVSPQTETNYSLISQRHRWRLVLFSDESGRRVAEWRCPSCWSLHRDAKRTSAR